MNTIEFERYLHLYFPVSKFLGVSVLEVGPGGVRLCAPLETNINRSDTAFGGSLSALAILSAWGWLRLRLDAIGFSGDLVIQRNALEYLVPATSDFEAYAHAPEPAQWARFEHTLARRGRARIKLHSDLRVGDLCVARFHGQYVAISDQRAKVEGLNGQAGHSATG